jgi:CHASE1-domain containing sensor protein
MAISSSPSDGPVTREEFRRFKLAVIKKLKFLEGLLDDAFEKINEVENNTVEKTDEALDRASRAERAVRRLKKEFESE